MAKRFNFAMHALLPRQLEFGIVVTATAQHQLGWTRTPNSIKSDGVDVFLST